MLKYTRLERLARDKHYCLFGPFVSCEENKVLLIQPLIHKMAYNNPGNTKGGSITVLLTSCLTGLDQSVLQIKTKNVSCHAADSRPVKLEVNSTVILTL